jgi:hypothetical protein
MLMLLQNAWACDTIELLAHVWTSATHPSPKSSIMLDGRASLPHKSSHSNITLLISATHLKIDHNTHKQN